MHDNLSQIVSSTIVEETMIVHPRKALFPIDTKTYQKTNNVRFLCI